MLIYEENGYTYIGGEPQEGTIGMECAVCGHIEMIEVEELFVTIEGNVLYKTRKPLNIKGDGRNQHTFHECPSCGHTTICIEEGGEDDRLLEPNTRHTTERETERGHLPPDNLKR